MKTIATVTATLSAYIALTVSVLVTATNRLGASATPWEVVAASVLLGAAVLTLATVAYCHGITKKA
ncbi:MAG: hypothetical protein PHO41_06950 [Eubacteriales bacterium]|nr:hypothetical protein [Eubacteriales bacterium]